MSDTEIMTSADYERESTRESEPDPISIDERELHLAALKRHGSKLCPLCKGLGFTRPERGKHIPCALCKGVGSVPLES